MPNSSSLPTGRRIAVIASLSLLLLLIGTSGFMLIQDFSFIEALYMTVITLSSVGFGEVRPLDNSGRIFVIILIFMGVSCVGFTVAFFTQMVLDGNLLEVYRRRKLKKQLGQLENHFIVCGYGQMGQIVVAELRKQRVPVVVIEHDENALLRLKENLILHLAGDATEETNLQAVGITRAKGLVSVVSKDSENVFIVLTARDLNRGLLILARAGMPGTEQRLHKAGADRVVSPYAIGAIQIVHSILRPTVTDFLKLALSGEGMELSMEEIRVPQDSALAGIELMESGIRSNYNLIVMAIKRLDGAMVFNPVPQHRLEGGDILVVIGTTENLSRFGQDLCGCLFPTFRPGAQ
ncbi:MAG: potassium channel protein [Desulfobacteraceae bacterium]|nr:potassium channel protein [Desulfobacteraceae bacterium]